MITTLRDVTMWKARVESLGFDGDGSASTMAIYWMVACRRLRTTTIVGGASVTIATAVTFFFK